MLFAHQIFRPFPETLTKAVPKALCLHNLLELECGRYRHYKGNEYVVLGVALHSETLEKLVVYRADYGDRGLWVRPLSMFLEMVEISGVQKARFQYLED